MENYDIYNDIAERTNGDVYIGVVGPVRCGKSTFITNFMQSLVIPNIKNKHDKERALDELPQSADGNTIMTTQPKFVPNDAVSIKIDDKIDLAVRMIDCVGYLIDGVSGDTSGNKPRMVKTPWSTEEMPFEEAAEKGTDKVILDHSTIGVLVTTDGSVASIPRANYIKAEEKVVEKLKSTNKPFVMILNCKEPDTDENLKLKESLEKKYQVPVLNLNVTNLKESDINEIFTKILAEFPINKISVKLPKWIQALPFEDELIKEITNEVQKAFDNATKIGNVDGEIKLFSDSDNFKEMPISSIDMANGTIVLEVEPNEKLFYTVLSRECNLDITDDFTLISYMKQLSVAKKEYDKISSALEQVKQTGYGVVEPNLDDMELENPKIVKQGGKFGVKLKATAPSLHIMKVDIETEINPIVGTEQQSEDLVKYLSTEFENSPEKLWETNMFGKSLSSLVKDGISSKITSMPTEVQNKMRKTLRRIVNEGKGGVICILL